jgi:hypothetical protein
MIKTTPPNPLSKAEIHAAKETQMERNSILQ